MGAAIRAAEEAKVLLMAVIGKREEAGGTVAVRARAGDDLRSIARNEFVTRVLEVGSTRRPGLVI